MLNIPDSVKALFKRDGVRKNFRVHFPNGEFPDITNENVVQESVVFTESLCSQDVLKFGTTESSVIEFETVGIGNMYGMKIECGLEISLSSLSAADRSAIAAGTWDGTYFDNATGKNILDVSQAEVGKNITGQTASRYARVFVPCNPSTTYTLSVNNNIFSNGYQAYAETATVTNPSSYTGMAIPQTITTKATTNYLVFQFGISSRAITMQDLVDAKIQLELGSSATDYEPYGYSDAWFRVPYGTFRVESCPRDHQAMTHRKVEAYGYTVARISLNSPFELAKLRYETNGIKTYTPDLRKLVYAGIGWYNQSALDDYTNTDITPWGFPFYDNISNEYVWATGNPYISHYIKATTGKSYTMQFSSAEGATYPTDALYGIDFGTGLKIDDVLATLRPIVESNIPAAKQSEAMRFLKNYLSPHVYWETTTFVPELLTYNFVGFNSGMPVFYPKSADGKSMFLTLTQSVTLDIDGTTISLNLLDSKPKLYKYTDSATPVPLSFEATGKRTGYIFANTVQTDQYGSKIVSTPSAQVDLYTFSGAYDFTALLNGMLELNAQFGFVNRNNEFDLLRLSRLSPVALLPGDYSGFWWDEYDVLPVGTIEYQTTYEDGTENIYTYQFGNGASVYNISDNELLEVLEGADKETIDALLDDGFIPHLDPLAFTPIELDMKGLPYLEAGDYLTITAEDGTVVNTFIMRQEISGIQMLLASIESVNGQIIDSEDSA